LIDFTERLVRSAGSGSSNGSCGIGSDGSGQRSGRGINCGIDCGAVVDPTLHVYADVATATRGYGVFIDRRWKRPDVESCV